MSYSRWGESRFYCYWAASEGNGTKNREVFEICGITNFTFRELTDHLDDCLDAAIELQNLEDLDPCTPAEREELKGYIAQFIEAVEANYARINR